MTEATTPDAATPKLELLPSRQFPAWLAEQNLSLAFTTYQTGKLFLVGLQPNGRLSIFERSFNRAMGLWASPQTLYLSTLFQLWRFDNALEPGQAYQGYDRLYVPQVAWTTGDLDVHDVAEDAEGRIVFVNTLFGCLAMPSESASFVPLWRPPFLSRLAAEDRCHLNGLALRDGRPRTSRRSAARTSRTAGAIGGPGAACWSTWRRTRWCWKGSRCRIRRAGTTRAMAAGCGCSIPAPAGSAMPTSRPGGSSGWRFARATAAASPFTDHSRWSACRSRARTALSPGCRSTRSWCGAMPSRAAACWSSTSHRAMPPGCGSGRGRGAVRRRGAARRAAAMAVGLKTDEIRRMITVGAPEPL